MASTTPCMVSALLISRVASSARALRSQSEAPSGSPPPAAPGGWRGLLATFVGASDGFADGVFEIRIAAEAELLGELHHARLADAQGVRQLLRGVVAQQLGVLEDEVGDAPFHV